MENNSKESGQTFGQFNLTTKASSRSVTYVITSDNDNKIRHWAITSAFHYASRNLYNRQAY